MRLRDPFRHMDRTVPAHIPWTPSASPENALEIARAQVEAELERHHPDCFAWAMACCGRDRTEAEDVLQTSYLKVLDGRATFAGRSSFKTWLFGVIRRTASEHRRWRALRRFRSGSLDGRVDPSPDAATAVGNSESAARLVCAVATLPARQRELLHLVFYQDLTIAEAASVLGVSLGTARTHYERGKQRLRQLLTLEDDR